MLGELGEKVARNSYSIIEIRKF
ncbi:MAG: hypothetical protein G01um101466_675, partial [Parcubacteria group bacterium Gr01-1014_66]